MSGSLGFNPTRPHPLPQHHGQPKRQPKVLEIHPQLFSDDIGNNANWSDHPWLEVQAPHFGREHLPTYALQVQAQQVLKRAQTSRKWLAKSPFHLFVEVTATANRAHMAPVMAFRRQFMAAIAATSKSVFGCVLRPSLGLDLGGLA